MKTPSTLVVAGVGPAGPSQFTLEAIAALKSCAAVFAVAHPESLPAFAATSGIKLESVPWQGQKPASGGVSTEALAALLLKALEQNARVGLVVDGSPQVFSPVDALSDAIRKAGHAVESIAAVGSLDTVLLAVQRHWGSQASGFTVVNALSCDWAGLTLGPGMGLFLYNVPAAARSAEALAAIQAALARCAGKRRLAFVETLAGGENFVETAVSGLEDALRRVGVNATLCAAPSEISPRKRGTS